MGSIEVSAFWEGGCQTEDYIRYPVSGIRYPVSGIRYPVPGTRCPVSGVRTCRIRGVAAVERLRSPDHIP